MKPSLVVVPTGTANTASVVAGFRRLDAVPEIARDATDVAGADRVVLPGVGSFGAAMEEIDRVGMRQALQERLSDGRPTLAICIGMQLLASTSEESEGATGLGHVVESVGRFPNTVRVPQLGWNQVRAGIGCRLLSDGWAYFANSYRIDRLPEGWSGATTDHGGEFVAAMERDEILACQFHPELSGSWGSGILARWLGRRAA
jgi:imidazole glycerol phosphate synthase glutamine amidotransferase subunit